MSEHRGPTLPEGLERRPEQRDLSTRGLLLSLLGLALLTVAAAWLMASLFGALERRARARDPEPAPLVETGVTPPQPRLETRPGQIVSRSQALEQMQLTTYGWIDRQAGIVRIPVDRAIEIIAERGLPQRDSEDRRAARGEQE